MKFLIRLLREQSKYLQVNDFAIVLHFDGMITSYIVIVSNFLQLYSKHKTFTFLDSANHIRSLKRLFVKKQLFLSIEIRILLSKKSIGVIQIIRDTRRRGGGRKVSHIPFYILKHHF